jgi:hypothetical protein
VPFAQAGALSRLTKVKDVKMKEDATQEPPNFTRGPTCSSVHVALSLRSLLSSLRLIILKDKKMKEDANKSLQISRGAQLAPLFM